MTLIMPSQSATEHSFNQGLVTLLWRQRPLYSLPPSHRPTSPAPFDIRTIRSTKSGSLSMAEPASSDSTSCGKPTLTGVRNREPSRSLEQWLATHEQTKNCHAKNVNSWRTVHCEPHRSKNWRRQHLAARCAWCVTIRFD